MGEAGGRWKQFMRWALSTFNFYLLEALGRLFVFVYGASPDQARAQTTQTHSLKFLLKQLFSGLCS